MASTYRGEPHYPAWLNNLADDVTGEGAAFLARARRVLREVAELKVYSDHITAGDEVELTVIIGDLTPLPPALALLKDFFAGHRQTRLNLRFETLSAP